MQIVRLAVIVVIIAGSSVSGQTQALEDQLGLKLQSIRAPVEFIVIDAIERPAAN